MRTVVPFLLLLGLFAAATGQDPAAKPAEKPKPKFTISKETTFVTGPVDKEGYIDYVAALNERLKKGVTPENNAVVLLCKALGPRPEGTTMPAEFYEWLGIAEPPEQGEYFVDRKQDYSEESKEFEKQLDRATKRPWAANQYPLIGAWLKTNEKPLAVVIEASKRPQYFYPLVPKKRESGLMAVLVPHVQECRVLANALVARAMLRASEGRWDDAWQDLLACHRLSRLIGRGGTVIEGLVAVAIDIFATHGDLAFLERVLDAKRVTACLGDLQQLPPMPPIADQVDITERFAFLDTVMKFDRYGVGYLERLAGTGGERFSLSNVYANVFWSNIDLDAALREGNGWYDRVAAALREKDRAVRAKQLVVISEQLDMLRPKKAKTQGKYLGTMLTQVLFPSVGKLQNNADRREQHHRNLLVTFALAIHHREHGRYPATLAELAPKYLAEVPLDLFTGKPLVYLPSEKGYLLYSLGPNGQDDGGRARDDNPAADDLSVRMPLPKP